MPANALHHDGRVELLLAIVVIVLLLFTPMLPAVWSFSLAGGTIVGWLVYEMAVHTPVR